MIEISFLIYNDVLSHYDNFIAYVNNRSLMSTLPFPTSGLRLRRLSLAAVVTSFAAAVALVFFLATLWLKPGVLEAHLNDVTAAPALAPLTADRLMLAGVVLTLAPLLQIATLVESGRLFWLFAAGRAFDPCVPVRLRRLGRLALAVAFVGVLTRTLATLIVTSVNPSGARTLSIGFGSGDLVTLVTGFLLLAFSMVMAEALRLARENESFV